MRELLAIAIIVILLIPVGAGQNENEKKVIFVVNANLYPEIKNTLAKFTNSVEGYQIEIKTWGENDPQTLRNYLQEQHPAGAVLVGNITIPTYYNPITKELVLSTYYYADLSGKWAIRNGMAVPEKITAASMWLGVVRSTDMGGNNATQINRYFEKATLYEQGKISALAEAVGFVDDDFRTMYQNVSDNLHKLYPAHVNYLAKDTTLSTFEEMLTENYAFAYIIAHSNGKDFFIKQNGYLDYITSGQIDALHPSILFYTDISCHGADFEKGAITNHLIMRGAGLGALASTGILYPQPMSDYYSALGSGASFGDAMLKYIKNSLTEKNGFDKYVADLCFLGVPLLHTYEPHGYREINNIKINGDEELKNFAAEMGLPGTGTASDPIRITGFYIHHHGNLKLSNCSLYVDVEKNYFSVTNTTAIAVENCAHVKITSNTIIGGFPGIYVSDSSNIVIANNFIQLSNTGILTYYKIAGAKKCDIHSNTVDRTDSGIVVWGPGRYMRYISDLSIRNNRVTNFSQDGIAIDFVSHSLLTENHMDSAMSQSSRTTGILLDNAQYNTVSGNTIKNVTLLMTIWNAWNNRIYENNFYGHFSGTGIKFEFLAPNIWNTSSVGNYWQQWADRNGTNDQNYDGIVDYPYVLAPGNVDYHPLKYPVGQEQYAANMPFIISTVLIFIVILAALGCITHRKKKSEN